MSETIDRHLNEALRDAMLGYYMAHGISETLKKTIRTPNDLYNHWLLDVQVSQMVPSSPVASAITSVQHYINRIESGLEPGYETQGMSADESLAWREFLQTYPLWSASQQLRYHPADYLDPTLRQDKSESFLQLENDLSQYRIQPDTVLNAVQSYLSRFEEIANIQTLNGYIDGDAGQLTDSTYYFVGKSSTDDTYYWRSLDLSKRSTLKPDTPAAVAWTDWKKINLTFSADTAAHSIRPVFFNNRLFIVWAETIQPLPSSLFTSHTNDAAQNPSENEKKRQAEWRISRYVKFRLCFAYRKVDGSWSLPRTALEELCVFRSLNALTPEQLKNVTQTVAVVDTRSPPTLFMGMMATQLDSDSNQQARFFQAVSVDQSLDIKIVAAAGSPGRYTVPPNVDLARLYAVLTTLFAPKSIQAGLQAPLGGGPDRYNYFSEPLLPQFAHQYFTLFLDYNKDNLQFKTRTQNGKSITLTDETPSHADEKKWNFESKSAAIENAKTITSTYDPATKEIIFTSKITSDFLPSYSIKLSSKTPYIPPELEGSLQAEYSNSLLSIILTSAPELSDSNTSEIKLGERSMIRIHQLVQPSGNFSHHTLFFKNLLSGDAFPNAIHDENSILLTLESRKPDGYIEFSLEGKFINKHAFTHLITHADRMKLVIDRYSGYSLPGDLSSSKKLHFENAMTGENMEVSTPSIRFYKHVIMQSKLPDVATPQAINNSTARILNFTDTEHESLAGALLELKTGNVATARIKIPETSSLQSITVIHGVIALESHEETGVKNLGHALKAVTCAIEEQSSDAPTYAPCIKQEPRESGGTTQFIDFSASSTPKLPAIHLNTDLAGELVKITDASLEPLFSYAAQNGTEPAKAGNSPPGFPDFQSAQGKYLRELYLYLPWTIAHRLNQEQQYAHAETWLHYLFDPRHEQTWKLSLLDPKNRELSYACHSPVEPHYLALSFPTYLRKALYHLYVDILINRGDAAYRLSTPDSLAEAKLWYIRAQSLLGTRPSTTRADVWVPLSLESLLKPSSEAIRQLEHTQASQLSQHCKNAKQQPWFSNNPYFHRPLNTHLVARWDMLESRLHGLRHHLDITGKPMRRSLFAAPLPPSALLTRRAQGTSALATLSLSPLTEVGHYRFQVIFGHALGAVESLLQFGTTLLSLIERKEQAQHLELQQQHAWELAELVVTQQTQALIIDEKNKEALHRSRAIIQGRLDFLAQQLKEGISANERLAGQHYVESADYELAAAIAGAGAGLAMLAPNIFGTSVGGVRLEGPFYTIQAIAQGQANTARANGNDLDRTELFKRRAQEWTHAHQQAHLELGQIDTLLLVHTEQEKATHLQLRNARTALAQTKASYQLLGRRFTTAQLYQWLNAKLSTFYYALYDNAQSLCLAAEACWQYETAIDREFFQSDAWHNASRGLLSAETLKLNLTKMNTAYLQHTPRELEITKTVSLRHRLVECSVATSIMGAAATATKTWEEHKADLVKTGTVDFALSKALLDEDYPGHTLRRIKYISVSLPATLGPYEDIRATLIQTRSEIERPDASPKVDLRVHQQIALSSGLDDSGLFTLRFDSNDRYLPFEYTGAISKWTLAFPNPAKQKAVLESINDIVIHLRYTARATPQTGGRT
ncbi:neuraminidase-like domain-containing protein [Pseudomonas sp. 15FMM2]|uniref:Neuraminidase-like domain-containing protein n=1 Tax=Pseudomonas imrae TaxID=2992837 RepID=A0ACC7PBJ2_9PSED